MLNVNHLTGFGVSDAAGAGYRYLRLYISTCDASFSAIDEIDWIAAGVDYPTQTMTSDTTPSPLVVSASSAFGPSYLAWRAMDNTTVGSYWSPSEGGIPAWHKIDLGLGNAILPTSIGITPYSSSSLLPTAFVCEGSNNGAFSGEQVTLGTFSPGTSGWTAHTRRTFTF